MIPARYLAFGLIAVVAVGWYGFVRDDGPSEPVKVAVSLPATLSPAASAGKALFDENCVACHGPDASGSADGPPLIHKIYESSHHADMSFFLAVMNGVRGHHWAFGDMDPVPGLVDADVQKIVTYVREVQHANGIR